MGREEGRNEGRVRGKVREKKYNFVKMSTLVMQRFKCGRNHTEKEIQERRAKAKVQICLSNTVTLCLRRLPTEIACWQAVPIHSKLLIN